MPRRKQPKSPKAIAHTKHDATRANIPTEELRDFVAEDEQHPATMLYARDPSLDPQLVWKGKDEQDRSDLAIPVVPIYIQEKIHPHAIIEDVRAHSRQDEPQQMDLFADFNGIEFEELIEFYQHQQQWSNRMILGDSLQVMTSLAEKEGLKGRVQMIYLDPPYGIKFGSNWQVSTRKRQVRDGRAEDVVRQPEQVKAFRDTWELGIHSYLSYLRDRLVVARELLTDSGSVFVQIGDENVHLVRSLLDETFGSESYCGLIFFLKTTGKGSGLIDSSGDYLLWYAKNKENTKVHPQLTFRKASTIDAAYTMVELPNDFHRRLTRAELRGDAPLPEGRRFMPSSLYSDSGGKTTGYLYSFQNREFGSLRGYFWRTNETGMTRLVKANRILISGRYLRYKMFADDYPVVRVTNYWDDVRAGGFGESKVYVVQTTTDVVSRCLLMTTDPGDLVLDPTCGSGTTAYVAEQWGRRWITLDTSRVAITLARTRLMAARYPYYLLADSAEGVKKQKALGFLPPDATIPATAAPDIRKGFVYKQVPHITLRDIANNEEIDAIYDKWQAQIEPIIKDLTGLRNLSGLQEWEIPRAAGEDWSQQAKELLARFWELRQARQKEIDASIARSSASETLYDQPYEDRKKLRVTGPFTVESLSPHRVLSTDEPRPASEKEAQEASASDFVGMILENLKKAGVQNTIKNERLKFERLEPYAGEWLQAEGEYSEQLPSLESGEGPGVRSKRVAVAIGPEHGTVGPQLVKEAAKEAVRGIGFDLLLVCGFAFDPHVSEEAQRYGSLTVLPVRMNPDLAMGDALLKKTGSGNLFMVFGEPDVDIRTLDDGQMQVEIRGLDIYDPTTGVIRANSTDDIACWFIDTEYNEESFFVRHAYFTGADKPYEKLKRALRADIDEEAWAALYSTTSRPFPRPETGKIAIKVINHYGDEVLKVYEV